jgi:hypothetical protein
MLPGSHARPYLRAEEFSRGFLQGFMLSPLAPRDGQEGLYKAQN